ncbi:MAG: c-type cytochrome [Syntrophobacteraceae bacterium]
MKAARSASTRVLMSYALFAALLAFASLALFGCYYAEMRDDEAVQAYNEEFPQMPKKTIPVNGGIWVEREANPMELVDPLADNSKMIAWGWERYRFYCVQCHGPMLDGNGTVGQSFAPLPDNLKSSKVQEQSDGEIFYKIRFGFNRHPPLYATLTDDETWAVIRYVRSMREKSEIASGE